MGHAGNFATSWGYTHRCKPGTEWGMPATPLKSPGEHKISAVILDNQAIQGK